MYSQIKVGPLRLKIWWFIFLAIQVFFLAIMIGTFGTQFWTHSSISNSYISMADFEGYYSGTLTHTNYFDGSTFSGSLIKCENGCGDNYRNAKSDWCDVYDNLKEQENPCVTNCQQQNESKTLCDTFNALSMGTGVFFVFEVASMIGIVVWSGVMFCFLRKIQQCFCCTYCCSVFSCITHYIAIISWIMVSGSMFKNDCSTFPSDGSKIHLCNNDGPGLGLFLMIVLPMAVVFYHVIACKASKRKDFAGQNDGGQMNPAGEAPQYKAAGNAANQYVVENPGPWNAPPQYNPVPLPQYNPVPPPQYNPGNAPPQYNPGYPPLQSTPGNSPPQYNPVNAPPQYSPVNATPQYSPGDAPQYSPGNAPPQYSPGNAPPQDKPENPPPKYGAVPSKDSS